MEFLRAGRDGLECISPPLIIFPAGGDIEPSRIKCLLMIRNRKKAPQSLEVAWVKHRSFYLELVKRRQDIVMDEGWHSRVSSAWQESPDTLEEWTKREWLVGVSISKDVAWWH